MSRTQPFYIAAHDSLVDEPPRTLKHGDTFALFDHYGDLASRRGNTLGLYHKDTRHLSRLKLTVEQRSPLLLCSTVRTNNAVLDVDLTNPDIKHGDCSVLPKDTVHFTRTKFLWNGGCYETVTLAQFRRDARCGCGWISTSTRTSPTCSRCVASSGVRAAA